MAWGGWTAGRYVPQVGEPVYFHVAPRSAREAIEYDRILWASQDEECDPDEQGVYLFDNLVDAHRFGNAFYGSDYDIWRVVPEPDDLVGILADPLETGGWMIPSEHGIEPLELQLEHTAGPPS